MKKVFMLSVTATLALLACVFLPACGREVASEGLEYVVNVEETTHPETGVVTAPDTGTTVPAKYKKKTCTITGLGSCTDTEVVIPKAIDGYTVTGIGDGMLAESSAVTSVKLPSSVSSIEPGAFRDCPTLTSVGVSRGNTFYYVKSGCLIETATGRLICGLGDIDIPSDGSIKDIAAWAFAGNTELTELTVPDGVSYIGACAFKDCTALRSIVIPPGVAGLNGGEFVGCTALESVTFKNNVQVDGYAFQSCAALRSVRFEGSNAYINQYAFRNCQSLTDISFDVDKLFIGVEAFRGCSLLSSITLPCGTTYIGEAAFSQCSSLTEIRYSGTMLEWESVGKDKKWDNGSDVLTVRCSNGDVGDNVVFTDPSFTYRINADNQSCTIVSVELDGIEPVIPDTTSTGLRVTGIAADVFRDMTELVGITLPAGLTVIGNAAFCGCTSLRSITLPNGVTEIGQNAFKDCTSLHSITLPDGLTSIGNSAFRGCASLRSITLPDGITDIRDYTFDGCTALESADIPVSVKNIHGYAFGNCPALTDVNYAGTTSQWQRVTRRYSWYKNSPISIHCTDGDGKAVPEDD